MQLLQLMGAALGRVTVPRKLPIGREPPIRGTSCFYLHDHAYHVWGSAVRRSGFGPLGARLLSSLVPFVPWGGAWTATRLADWLHYS